eukprot:129062-Prorocentrum_minimum.AAC.2
MTVYPWSGTPVHPYTRSPGPARSYARTPVRSDLNNSIPMEQYSGTSVCPDIPKLAHQYARTRTTSRTYTPAHPYLHGLTPGPTRPHT